MYKVHRYFIENIIWKSMNNMKSMNSMESMNSMDIAWIEWIYLPSMDNIDIVWIG